jgi:hypothetical protein
MRGRIDNGEDSRFECGRQFNPCLDYLRQVTSIFALNLCAWLCIGPVGILCNGLTLNGLRMFCGRFDSLHPLRLT